MTIDKETEKKILRFHFVEKWRVGTIATQLRVHHSVVDRVLSKAGMPKAERAIRASIIDPYLPFITETLEQFPKLTAARLFHMIKERGYPGGATLVRERVAELRPKPAAEAYLRLKTLPGEQSQVDWGHFGSLQIGQAKRPLMAFVMVLSWSRLIFLRFFLNQTLENFLRGHVAAFNSWQGCPKTILYDNLKAAVLERCGDAIRFNPSLLELAGHYHFEPRPVAIARGNEKGRVERAIRYIRSSFFAARQWQDLNDLNRQADAWCQGVSAQRPCPEKPELTVWQAFEEERARLLPLPSTAIDTDESVPVRPRKTPYVRFDQNDYSIPHTHVNQSLTVRADLEKVRILAADKVIAEHTRSFSRREQIEQEAHINALWLSKTHARLHRGQDRLGQVSPLAQTLLQLAVERGHILKTTVNLLLELLDAYGREELHNAIEEALQQQSPYPEAVRQILERRREERQQPPPIAVAVPDRIRQYSVRPGKLADYDDLTPAASEENDDDTE